MDSENNLKCPNCLSPVSVDADLCPHCKVEFYNCSQCNALLLETDTVCKNCNSDLEVANEPSPAILHSNRPRYKYKSLEVLTNILIILLCAVVLFSVINIYGDINEISYFNNNYERGGVLYYDDSSSEYFLISISQLLFTVVFFISLIIYFIWVRQAYRNLSTLQLKPTEFSSGWTIGSYFVPILNLFRPYTMMKEIWYGSKPIADGTASYISEKHFGLSSSGFLQLWWAFVLLDQFLSNISFRLYLKAETHQQFLVSYWFDLFSSMTGIIVSFLLLYLIWTITEWQSEKIQNKPKKFCVHCGNKMDLDALLCNLCGKQLI